MVSSPVGGPSRDSDAIHAATSPAGTAGIHLGYAGHRGSAGVGRCGPDRRRRVERLALLRWHPRLHPVRAPRPDRSEQRRGPAGGVAAAGRRRLVHRPVPRAGAVRLSALHPDPHRGSSLRVERGGAWSRRSIPARARRCGCSSRRCRRWRASQAAAPTGVAFWSDGADRRIFAFRNRFLYALDAATGEPIAGFGDGGRVDLTPGGARSAHGGASPIVVADVVVAAGTVDGAGRQRGCAGATAPRRTCAATTRGPARCGGPSTSCRGGASTARTPGATGPSKCRAISGRGAASAPTPSWAPSTCR